MDSRKREKYTLHNRPGTLIPGFTEPLPVAAIAVEMDMAPAEYGPVPSKYKRGGKKIRRLDHEPQEPLRSSRTGGDYFSKSVPT